MSTHVHVHSRVTVFQNFRVHVRDVDVDIGVHNVRVHVHRPLDMLRTWSVTRTRTQCLGALVRLILIGESLCMNLKIFSLEMSTSQLQKFDVLLVERIWAMKYQTIGFVISC